MHIFGLLLKWGEVRPKEVKNKTAYDNLYFAEKCCIDSQTFKSLIYVEKPHIYLRMVSNKACELVPVS